MDKKWLLALFFVGLGVWWLWSPNSSIVREGERTDLRVYTNDVFGFRVAYPIDLDLREYSDRAASIGVEQGEAFAERAALTVIESVAGDTWGSLDAFVEARTVALCAADGPDRSVYCTDFVEREEFVSEAGDAGMRVVLNQESVVPGDNMLIEQKNRGPFYIFPLRDDDPDTYAALVIHPPIAGEDGEHAGLVARVADMFTRLGAQVGERDSQTVFGFIRDVDLSGERVALVFDEALWHSGEEAKDAAIRAGTCTEATREECTPNDFFIENSDDAVERYTVANAVEVVMITYRAASDAPLSQHEISFEEFITIIADDELHWNSLPYRLHLNAQDEVVKIEEVYVP